MSAFVSSVLSFLDDAVDRTVIGGFDRIGYTLRQPLWNPADTTVDLSGQVCLITGANGGLGFAMAKALAQRGATVIMGCRSRERGEAARQELLKYSPQRQVFLELLDVGVMPSVQAFAARFKGRWPRLDLLIHNAGALLNKRRETADGIETTLATHVLGPYLLTYLLKPQFEAGARVIFVASGGMYLASLHPEDLQFKNRHYHGATAYAEAKRGQVTLTQLWAKAFADDGILVNAMHPGWVDTPGIQDALPGFRLLTKPILRKPEQGADTAVWLASKPDLTISGEFFCDRRPRPVYRLGRGQNSPAEIRDWWRQLGELSGLPQPFPLEPSEAAIPVAGAHGSNG